ncbi:FG-GAP-like repeat-containing protein [Acidobacteria bacterium AH-259-D05]|nr:FG-GAP-like repeat-containing protein [Acidobacteria bacterium AH-259-D05]
MRFDPSLAGLTSIVPILLFFFAAPEKIYQETQFANRSQFDLHYARGVELLSQGRTVEAEEEFETCLEISEDNANVHYQLARLHLTDYYQNRELARVRQSLGPLQRSLTRALELDANHIGALMLAHNFHRIAKLLHYDPNRAYDIGLRILTLRPRDFDFALKFCEWLSGEVRFTIPMSSRVPQDAAIGLQRAVGHLEKLLQDLPPYSRYQKRALFLMGTALSQLGQFEEAMRFFHRYLDCPEVPAIRPCAISDTERIDALREIGTSLFKLGRYQEAARFFASAVSLRVNIVDLWLLQLCLDRVPPNSTDEIRFPLREEQIDSANPPLLKFTPVARELGVNKLDGNGPSAWGDYDQDGDEDLLAAGSSSFIALYQNEGSRFIDVTERAGLAEVPSGYSLNFVDYDNDGFLDIYLSANGWSGPVPNRLFHNKGNGSFEDVSAQAGTNDPGSGFVSLWGDFDNDGFIDLLVSNGVLQEGSTVQLYRNRGDGTFANVTERAGLSEPPEFGTIGSALADYDKDGYLDIFINGWNPAPNRLYHNNGDFTFTEVSEQAGVAQPAHRGFVSFFFDYNNDAYPDILTCSLAPFDDVLRGLTRLFRVEDSTALLPNTPRLFRNNQNGTFTDVTHEAGLYYPIGIMAGGVADLDNDGYADLYFGTGDPTIWRLEPNRFFRNNGNGTFSDLTMYTGLGNLAKGHGTVFSDYDQDGDLDMYTQLGGFFPADWAENELYRNELGNANNWLQVKLVGEPSNRFGIGAKLTLKAGALLVYREIQGSSGFGSTDSYRVHFGLAKNESAEWLEIIWPSGKKQILRNIPANQVITVREEDENLAQNE